MRRAAAIAAFLVAAPAAAYDLRVLGGADFLLTVAPDNAPKGSNAPAELELEVPAPRDVAQIGARGEPELRGFLKCLGWHAPGEPGIAMSSLLYVLNAEAIP